MISTYVVLLNWNSWGDTIECLESLFRLEKPGVRVIVCDNFSKDNSLDQIKAWAEGRLSVYVHGNGRLKSLRSPPCSKPVDYIEYDRDEAENGGKIDKNADLILIQAGANLGFAGGNNVGLRYALARDDFDYAWLLNNDTVVQPQALSWMVERMQEDPEAGMCGSTLLHYDDPDKVQAYGGGYYCKWIGLPWHQGRLRKAADYRNRDRAERWMNYVVGASMLVSKEFLRDVGLMCEDYFLYFEEVDWAIRAKGFYSLAYAPDSVVYHKVGASIGTSSNPLGKSITCDFFSLKNRLYFTKKYFPMALPTIYLSLIGAMLLRLVFGKWDRAWMIVGLLFGLERKPQGLHSSAGN